MICYDNHPMINTYETIFICSGDLSQDKVDTALEKVKSIIAKSEGKITVAELWGRRRLSYPIKRQRDGFYGYIMFSAPPQIPSALNHHYRVTDTILRGLTVKVDPRYVEKLRPALRTASSETPVPAEQAAADQSTKVSLPENSSAQESNSAT